MRAPWFETVARRWHHGRRVGRYWAVRSPEIRAALRAATPDSVLLVGNSHAEYIGRPDLGGRPSLNIAVGGSTAADCARHLATLHRTVLHRADRHVPVRCAASVLIIGTNDIMGWRHPERPRSADRFAAEVRRILGFLEAWSAQVFVAAVPPVGAWATGRDPEAVAVFSERLAALCAERGHGFFDPFAALRAGQEGRIEGRIEGCIEERVGGLAGSGLYRDGVHMADYTRLAAEIARLVVIDPRPPGPPAARPATPNRAAPLRVLRAAWAGRP